MLKLKLKLAQLHKKKLKKNFIKREKALRMTPLKWIQYWRYTCFCLSLGTTAQTYTRLIAALAFRDHNFAEYLHILNFLLRLYEKKKLYTQQSVFLKVYWTHKRDFLHPADSSGWLSYSQKKIRLYI